MNIRKELDTINKEYHYLNYIPETIPEAETYISVKDSICVKDMPSTAGSAILKDYKPVTHATCVQRLVDHHYTIIGKTAQDEFGFGSFAVNVGLGFSVPLNPFDKNRCTGGSSGGAAGLTQKASFSHVALGESTGGSIVTPASFCGVFGLCPTYGRISRNGVIDYGNSLDKVGPLAKNCTDIATTLHTMAGYDPYDSTTSTERVPPYDTYLSLSVEGMTIGVLKDTLHEGVAPEIVKEIERAIETLKGHGALIKEITLPLSKKFGIPAYYIMCTAEASTNLAKYCGLRYGAAEKLEGSFNEYFAAVRSKYLGEEAKRRIMLGTFVRMAGYRDAYYLKSLQVRQKIITEYQQAFKNVDVILSPTVNILPPTFAEIKQLSVVENYMLDVLTVSPNVAGLPHMNIPIGFAKGLPVGMMVTANHFQEGKLLQVAKEFDA